MAKSLVSQHIPAQAESGSTIDPAVVGITLNGNSGPDFRLGDWQGQWLSQEMGIAQVNGERIVIFTHTYPADLVHPQETFFE